MFLALLTGRLAAQEFAVRSTDGSWYTANSMRSRVEKRSADLATLFWKRDGEPGETRALRATPDGGVARLSSGVFRSTTISSLTAGGEVVFNLHFIMNSPRMVVDGGGDFLIVGDSLRMLRINRRGELVSHQSTLVEQVNSLAGIELSAGGQLFVAGGTASAGLNVTPNAAQKEQRGGTCFTMFRVPSPYSCSSGWVGRFDAKTFSLEALSYLGVADENFLNALAIDSEGNPVIAGTAKQRNPDREPYPRTETAVAPSTKERTGQVMTITRLNQDLDQVIDSTWLAGSGEATAISLAIDEPGRILIHGRTTSPHFPATTGWTRVCGPRQGANATFRSFGLRLSRSFDRVEGSTQFGDARAPGLIDFETRANCVFNGGSYDFNREVATGQIVTMIGGPFREEDTLTLNGAKTPILYRSVTQINFVLPREAGTGDGMVLELSGQPARRLDVRATKPVWIWNILEDGTLSTRDNFQINARRADGTLNSDGNGFRPEEEVLAYATGVDLGKPLQLFRNFYDKEISDFTANYVPGTFDSVVEFRFRNRELNGGVNVLGIVNDGVYSGSNPGFIWVTP